MSLFSAATELDVDSGADLYSFTLSRSFDKMILSKNVRVHEKPSNPWFEQDYRNSNVQIGVLKRSIWWPEVEMSLLHGSVVRKSRKDCVDPSVEITEN